MAVEIIGEGRERQERMRRGVDVLRMMVQLK